MSINESITTLEDLSNELIYHILEFLNLHHAFESFYDLNVRFRNLLVHSNLPIHIIVPSISKSNFHRYSSYLIFPHVSRIRSFQISIPFVDEFYLCLSPIINYMDRLERLIINNIESKSIEEIVNRLSCLSYLSSLIIKSMDNDRISTEIYRNIFRLSALKYCHIRIKTKKHLRPLPRATNVFSPIEYLIIDNDVLSGELPILLSYVPQLRRLSLGYLHGRPYNLIHPNPLVLNHLINVSLNLHGIPFNDFELLVSWLFRQVQILRFTAVSTTQSAPEMEYLNADRWQQLIITHLPNLRLFDFQHQQHLYRPPIDREAYQTKINQFNSLFWMEHQWFFNSLYYKTTFFNYAIFYSTNPYRRKSYLLAEAATSKINQSVNFDSVHRVSIYDKHAIDEFASRFRKAKELILSETCAISHHWISDHLNRIITCRQITSLTIQYHHLQFEQLLELLHFTPNIHTLKLHSIIFDSISINQHIDFQYIPKMNAVKNLTMIEAIALEKMQYLTALFPRLNCLITNFQQEDFESIMRFLLSNSNENVRYLSSLCILDKNGIVIDKVRILIESEQLLHNYSLKLIAGNSYLWW